MRDPERLGPWLHRVAVRIAVRAKSARSRRPDRSELLPGAAEAMPSAGAEPDRGRDELPGLVHEEVGRLPERYRAVVVLCYLEGETYEMAAARLRVPVGTIRSRLARARERLRGRLILCGVGVTAGAIATALESVAKGTSAAVSHRLVGGTVREAALAGSGNLAAGVLSARVLGEARRDDARRPRRRHHPPQGRGDPWRCSWGRVRVRGSSSSGAGRGRVCSNLRPRRTRSPPPPVADEPVEADRDKLRGPWVVIDHQQEDAGERSVGDVIIFGGDRFGWIAQGNAILPRGKTGGRVELETGPLSQPRRIDLVLDGPDPIRPGGGPPTFRGIYRLEGENRLKLCLAHPKSGQRPVDFDHHGRPGIILLTSRHVVAIGRGSRSSVEDRGPKGGVHRESNHRDCRRLRRLHPRRPRSPGRTRGWSARPGAGLVVVRDMGPRKGPRRGDRVQVREGHAVVYDVVVGPDDPVGPRRRHAAFARDRDTRLDVGLIKIQAGDDASEDGFNCDAHMPKAGPGGRPAGAGGRHRRTADRAEHTAADPARRRSRAWTRRRARRSSAAAAGWSSTAPR